MNLQRRRYSFGPFTPFTTPDGYVSRPGLAEDSAKFCNEITAFHKRLVFYGPFEQLFDFSYDKCTVLVTLEDESGTGRRCLIRTDSGSFRNDCGDLFWLIWKYENNRRAPFRYTMYKLFDPKSMLSILEALNGERKWYGRYVRLYDHKHEPEPDHWLALEEI